MFVRRDQRPPAVLCSAFAVLLMYNSRWMETFLASLVRGAECHATLSSMDFHASVPGLSVVVSVIGTGSCDDPCGHLSHTGQLRSLCAQPGLTALALGLEATEAGLHSYPKHETCPRAPKAPG